MGQIEVSVDVLKKIAEGEIKLTDLEDWESVMLAILNSWLRSVDDGWGEYYTADPIPDIPAFRGYKD